MRRFATVYMKFIIHSVYFYFFGKQERWTLRVPILKLIPAISVYHVLDTAGCGMLFIHQQQNEVDIILLIWKVIIPKIYWLLLSARLSILLTVSYLSSLRCLYGNYYYYSIYWWENRSRKLCDFHRPFTLY